MILIDRTVPLLYIVHHEIIPLANSGLYRRTIPTEDSRVITRFLAVWDTLPLFMEMPELEVSLSPAWHYIY
jgi:hypothetical protein